MPSHKLIDAFSAFRHECIWLQTTYNTFSMLYQSADQQVSDVMEATAPVFFADLNLILIDQFCLQVCKITDPAFTKVKNVEHPNLTVGGINDLLKNEQLFNAAIEEAASGLASFRESLIKARNKLVAHSDQAAVLAGSSLGEHSDEDRESFFLNLYRYVDEVGIAIGLGPLDFRVTSAAGDCLDLIRCLQAGQHLSRFR